MIDKLTKNVDHTLFRKLSDYIFQGKSLETIVSEYESNVQNGDYPDSEKIKSGKLFFDMLRHELRQIRKSEEDLAQIIVEHLFDNRNLEIEELSTFLEDILKE